MTRQLLRIATAGSVDDGKSTLIGRLLHDTDSLPLDHLEAVTDEEGVADLAALSWSMARPRRSDVVVSSISWMISGRVAASLCVAPVSG